MFPGIHCTLGFLLAGTLLVGAEGAPEPFGGLSFRCIGPFRGDRVTAVTGVRRHPVTFYFGATGGGVWKSTDGGRRWNNLSPMGLRMGSAGPWRRPRAIPPGCTPGWASPLTGA
ncbi:MAG: hypothetical protein HY823_04190 [Acidobacteria bacterium]|nr:hypothetical protein [Acidobacteriota bacterium]